MFLRYRHLKGVGNVKPQRILCLAQLTFWHKQLTLYLQSSIFIMKKNQRPIKGQKQTQSPKTEKFINPYAKPEIDLATLQKHFESLVAQNKPKQAYNTGLEIVQKLDTDPTIAPLEYAFLYKRLAELAGILKEHAAATRHFEKIIKIIEVTPIDDRFDFPEIYYHTGVSYLNLKNYDKSIFYFKKAIHIFETKEQDNDILLGNLYTKIADIYSLKQDAKNSAIFLQAAITLKEANHKKIVDEISENKAKLSEAQAKLSENEAKMSAYKTKIDENTKELIMHYQALGLAHQKLDKIEDCLADFETVLTLLESLTKPDIVEIASTYGNIAYCYAADDKFIPALDLYQKALLIFKANSSNEHTLLKNTLTEYRKICVYMQMDYEKATIQPYKDFITQHFPDNKV